nr:MAG TPA: hypothetical protein [Caudoviricetes sp.]
MLTMYFYIEQTIYSMLSLSGVPLLSCGDSR